MGENSKFAPTPLGVQYPGLSPSGTIATPKRRCFGFAAAFAVAVKAGDIASKKGSAKVAPRPRNTARRDKCVFVMNMDSLPSYCFRTP